MAQKRDTTKYRVVRNRKTVHVGITNDPERREQEHQRKYGRDARLVKEGRKTTRDGARRWEREQRKKGRPTGPEAAAHRSLSFSEYSDHYEHQRAGTRIAGSVSDAAPTVLDWEIGS